jgi:hypothetical protein
MVGGLLAIALVVVVQEVVIFATSTESSARDEAKRDFISECARRGLSPNEFTGPQRIKAPQATYGFVWTNPSNGNQIVTMVRFFPAGAESWLIDGKETGKFVPCSEENRNCQ